MSKDNLLKDAIADAKAVRETALANAKLIITEAFTPQLQSMISNRLKNEAEIEETPEGDFKGVGDGVPSGFDSDQKEVDPTIEKHREDEGKDVTANQDADPEKEKASAVGGGSGSDTVKLPGSTEIDEQEEEVPTDEPIDEPDVDSLAGEETPEEDAENADDLEIESIIKELEAEDDEIEEPQLSGDEVPPEDEEVPDINLEKEPDVDESTDVTSDQGQDPEKEKAGAVGGGSGSDTTELSGSTEIDLDNLVKEIEGELGQDEVPPEDDEEDDEKLDMIQKENTTLRKNLKEHRSVIQYLRKKLNEINLLNAKLLYSNKLFKGNTLSETQKLRIIESIDRANSVREVKLVYTTLAESFKVKRDNLTEAKKVVKGSSSKQIGSTKPSKEIVTEGNDLAARFKTLAGINKIVRIL